MEPYKPGGAPKQSDAQPDSSEKVGPAHPIVCVSCGFVLLTLIPRDASGFGWHVISAEERKGLCPNCIPDT